MHRFNVVSQGKMQWEGHGSSDFFARLEPADLRCDIACERTQHERTSHDGPWSRPTWRP